MRKYAEKTKVALPKLLETSFEVLKKGVSVGKAMVEKVFDIVDYFYDCEDVFDKVVSVFQFLSGWKQMDPIINSSLRL